MSGFTRELENKVLNHIFRNESYTPPEKVYVGLFTSAGEVAGAGYTRQEITFRESSNGRIVNDNEIRFPIAEEDWGTITRAGVFDSQTGGTQLTETTVNETEVIENKQVMYAIGDFEVEFNG